MTEWLTIYQQQHDSPKHIYRTITEHVLMLSSATAANLDNLVRLYRLLLLAMLLHVTTYFMFGSVYSAPWHMDRTVATLHIHHLQFVLLHQWPAMIGICCLSYLMVEFCILYYEFIMRERLYRTTKVSVCPSIWLWGATWLIWVQMDFCTSQFVYI